MDKRFWIWPEEFDSLSDMWKAYRKFVPVIIIFLLLAFLAPFAHGQAAGVGSIWSAVSATLQNGATANGNGTSLSVLGLSAIAVTVNCSIACTGGTTINFEGSEDNSFFSAVNGQQMGTCTIASTILNQSTTETVWEVNAAGLQSFRARISGYSAGTITITAHATAAPFNPKCDQANLFVAGNAGTTGTGASGNGIPRVTISNDSSLAANQSVQLSPGTTGGLTTFVLEPAASDNHTVIKNGAGQVYSLLMFNNSATVNYWRLYNAGTGFNGCNSATNLIAEGHIPGLTSDAGFVVDISEGWAFSTGISICVTSAYGQTATTNATATAISITIGYK